MQGGSILITYPTRTRTQDKFYHIRGQGIEKSLTGEKRETYEANQ